MLESQSKAQKTQITA